MADASRFPRLAPPFAIAGAAAGWLSAGLVQHLVYYAPNGAFRALAALIAMVFGGLTGALLRRFCVGKRYEWQLDMPDPDVRPSSDSWLMHVVTVLVAGAAAGATIMVAWDGPRTVFLGALAGLVYVLPFLPICAAVLSAARRAQRGRLGSLVAGADRRAVWGILAITLLIASFEGLPDWPAPQSNGSSPLPVAVLLIALSAGVIAIFIADIITYRRARRATDASLVRHEEGDCVVDDEEATRLDLGLGNDLHAQLHRGAAAYRSRHRAIALVQGDPGRALFALRGAIRRGALGLGIALAAALAHIAASSAPAARAYHEIRCDNDVIESCNDAIRSGIAETDINPFTILLFEHGCDRGDAQSCLSIAEVYRRGAGLIDPDPGAAAFFEYRAAQQGVCPNGQQLIRNGEFVCVK